MRWAILSNGSALGIASYYALVKKLVIDLPPRLVA